MVAISMFLEMNGYRPTPLCLRLDLLQHQNPYVEHDETTAPVAQHQVTYAGEHIITNPLYEQHELISS